MIEGSLSKSANYFQTKNGRKKTTAHYKFQSRGARGERKYKSVPLAAVSRVKQLIANGKRYRKLEAEYSRLVTEEALEGLKKTADV